MVLLRLQTSSTYNPRRLFFSSKRSALSSIWMILLMRMSIFNLSSATPLSVRVLLVRSLWGLSVHSLRWSDVMDVFSLDTPSTIICSSSAFSRSVLLNKTIVNFIYSTSKCPDGFPFVFLKINVLSWIDWENISFLTQTLVVKNVWIDLILFGTAIFSEFFANDACLMYWILHFGYGYMNWCIDNDNLAIK